MRILMLCGTGLLCSHPSFGTYRSVQSYETMSRRARRQQAELEELSAAAPLATESSGLQAGESIEDDDEVVQAPAAKSAFAAVRFSSQDLVHSLNACIALSSSQTILRSSSSKVTMKTVKSRPLHRRHLPAIK